jgi:hypothetical protein
LSWFFGVKVHAVVKCFDLGFEINVFLLEFLVVGEELVVLFADEIGVAGGTPGLAAFFNKAFAKLLLL